FGCGSAIASSSLATEWLKGMSLDQAQDLRNTQIVEELSLPPVKIHCSVLAEDAVKAALADYRKKNGLPVEDHDHAGDHAGGKAGA
ncbi:MAG: iron-sulfur cluster assembly scaffold protein, partial [bacterium]